MSRIENLGDYNKVREELQAVGDNLSALYKKVGDIAVAQNAPKLRLQGVMLTLAGEGILGIGGWGIHQIKKRKKLLAEEAELRKKFTSTVKAVVENETYSQEVEEKNNRDEQ